MNGEYTDEALIKKVLDGDAAAMKYLYDCHMGCLTAVVSRYIPDDDDLKDVLQEAFVKVFTSMRSFQYRGKGSLRAWMTKIAVNEALDFLHSRKATEAMEMAEIDDCCEEEPLDEPDVGNVPIEAVYEMIRHLPPGYRSVFNLYVFEGKSHKEIAEMLGIKENTSASQYHRAKALLATNIKEYLTTNKNKRNGRTMAK